jgi:predicted negative regulator of RcsB-dependent stress response
VLFIESKIMKKTSANKTKIRKDANMKAEYRFDYSKAKPNRFTSRMKDSHLVAVIDPDVAKVFTTTEQVNNALRALISAIPKK